MDDWRNGRNCCYTYFKITGDFDPDVVTGIIGLVPLEFWRSGDLRKNGTVYNFSLWEYGRCDEYDVYVENQMMKTIQDLIPKTDILCKIKKQYDVNFTLEIVPSIYVNDINPCLAPNREVIKFCYETETDLDIDLYVFNSSED
ncbi:MAG TPA: DUF4279 domain-containing protein [Oscillospiraceae bacterium]|nr:DUF4279 domain-containing protein [Oscillospiraceae bacterium]HPS35783.1 DUF4279 domain-containing protein [Oscillospiraceae bacterium]